MIVRDKLMLETTEALWAMYEYLQMKIDKYHHTASLVGIQQKEIESELERRRDLLFNQSK